MEFPELWNPERKKLRVYYRKFGASHAQPNRVNEILRFTDPCTQYMYDELKRPLIFLRVIEKLFK